MNDDNREKTLCEDYELQGALEKRTDCGR